VLYLRNRVVKEELDRVTLAADLGSEQQQDQNYIFMGSVNDMDDEENSKCGKIMVDMGTMA
jgi:hypothetical protein